MLLCRRNLREEEVGAGEEVALARKEIRLSVSDAACETSIRILARVIQSADLIAITV